MSLHDPGSVIRFGENPNAAKGVVILIHGRGSSAREIGGLTRYFGANSGLTYLVPQATGNEWYPQRFLRPLAENEPWLTDAFGVIDNLMAEAEKALLRSSYAGRPGQSSERIGLVGFSQGACLSLEYAYRNPKRYAFIGGLSGALIGPLDTPRPVGLASSASRSTLAGTPVLLGCADHDQHIPVEHVEQSAVVLGKMGAAVTKQIYPGSAHILFPEEIKWLQERSLALAGG